MGPPWLDPALDSVERVTLLLFGFNSCALFVSFSIFPLACCIAKGILGYLFFYEEWV